jgi:hypothetical protein
MQVGCKEVGEHQTQGMVIAVGRPVTRPPPHRSRRAVFSHRARQVYSRPPSGRNLRGGQAGLRAPNDPWSVDGEGRQPRGVARPVVAAPWAAPIEPRLQDPEDLGAARLESGTVAGHSVVVVGPAALGMAPRQQWLDFPTQFCHASAATGIQHQDGPGTPRAQRCEDHHGVYACAESRRAGRAQPPRLAMLGTAPMRCAAGV